MSTSQAMLYMQPRDTQRHVQHDLELKQISSKPAKATTTTHSALSELSWFPLAMRAKTPTSVDHMNSRKDICEALSPHSGIDISAHESSRPRLFHSQVC